MKIPTFSSPVRTPGIVPAAPFMGLFFSASRNFFTCRWWSDIKDKVSQPDNVWSFSLCVELPSLWHSALKTWTSLVSHNSELCLLKSTSPPSGFSLDSELVPLQDPSCLFSFTLTVVQCWNCCLIYFFWFSSCLRRGIYLVPVTASWHMFSLTF